MALHALLPVFLPPPLPEAVLANAIQLRVHIGGRDGLAHVPLKASNWHQLSDLFVSLFLESISLMALKKMIPLEI